MEYAHSLNNQGRVDEAIVYYQKAYDRDARCREAILTDLSPHYPPSFFLNTFEMDRSTLTLLRKVSAGNSDTRGYRKVLLELAKAELEAASHTSGEPSATHIVTASGCYSELGDTALASSTLQQAIKRHSNSYHLRAHLAVWLFNHGQYSESLPHLEWCHRRHPENKSMAKRIEVAVTTPDQPTQIAAEPSVEQQFR